MHPRNKEPSQPRLLPSPNQNRIHLTRTKNTRIPQRRHPMPLINRLIILAAQHLDKMPERRILRERDLVPALLVLRSARALGSDDFADDLRVAPALRPDGLRERLAVAHVALAGFRGGVESEEVEHADWRRGAGVCGSWVLPVEELGREFEALRGGGEFLR